MAPIHKKRKYELGRPAANTKVGRVPSSSLFWNASKKIVSRLIIFFYFLRFTDFINFFFDNHCRAGSTSNTGTRRVADRLYHLASPSFCSDRAASCAHGARQGRGQEVPRPALGHGQLCLGL